MTGSLQVVEGGVIIQAVSTRCTLFGQRADAGIVVALSAGDHFAVAVVGPDLDHVLRQVKMPLLVELHRFAVEIGAAGRVGDVCLDQIILLADQR